MSTKKPYIRHHYGYVKLVILTAQQHVEQTLTIINAVLLNRLNLFTRTCIYISRRFTVGKVFHRFFRKDLFETGLSLWDRFFKIRNGVSTFSNPESSDKGSINEGLSDGLKKPWSSTVPLLSLFLWIKKQRFLVIISVKVTSIAGWMIQVRIRTTGALGLKARRTEFIKS